MPSVLGYLRFGEIVSSSLSFFSLRCLSFARFGEPALAPFPGFLLAVSDDFVFLGHRAADFWLTAIAGPFAGRASALGTCGIAVRGLAQLLL